MINYPFLLISTICAGSVGVWISWNIVTTYKDKYGKITLNIPLDNDPILCVPDDMCLKRWVPYSVRFNHKFSYIKDYGNSVRLEFCTRRIDTFKAACYIEENGVCLSTEKKDSFPEVIGSIFSEEELFMMYYHDLF